MINLYLCSATSKLRALCTRRPFLIKIIAREQSVQHRASPFPVESVIGVILEDEALLTMGAEPANSGSTPVITA